MLNVSIINSSRAPLIAFGVEIVWDNQRINGSWDAYLASPADFAGDANLAKEREPGIEIIERTPKSLIITRFVTK